MCGDGDVAEVVVNTIRLTDKEKRGGERLPEIGEVGEDCDYDDDSMAIPESGQACPYSALIDVGNKNGLLRGGVAMCRRNVGLKAVDFMVDCEDIENQRQDEKDGEEGLEN